MSYHIYNSRALVLGRRSVRERDLVVSLLTEEFGLVRATARGVRSSRSRLGGILLDYALINVSLVKGKNVWRLTTAALESDLYRELKARPEALKAFARVLNLLEKLIHGEEPAPALFQDLTLAIKSLIEEEPSVEGWEIATVSSLLFHLGYLSQSDVPKTSLEALERKKELVNRINTSLKESGL
jgi:DNA repair protein RecO (recombination protein O)